MFILRFFLHFLSVPCYSVTLLSVLVASISQKFSSLLLTSGHINLILLCLFCFILRGAFGQIIMCERKKKTHYDLQWKSR